MKKPIKISSDFDKTLSLDWVQDLVKKLPTNEVEIHILTSRLGSMQRLKYPDLKSNEDIYRIASELEIPPYRISYTNQLPKWMILNEAGIDIHIDDDERELSGLSYYGVVKGFNVNAENFSEDLMNYISALINY